VSDLLWQGLIISFSGMGLTFLALGLLILTMIVLERVFRPQPERVPAEADQPAGVDDEIVAAIAVALARARPTEAGRSDSLGATLQNETGRWWLVGRAQQRAVVSPRITHRREPL
jgi:sodium pump decarboxylase gamma subunit